MKTKFELLNEYVYATQVQYCFDVRFKGIDFYFILNGNEETLGQWDVECNDAIDENIETGEEMIKNHKNDHFLELALELWNISVKDMDIDSYLIHENNY